MQGSKTEKLLMFFMNMNFNPYIYILYHQSNLLHYLSPFPASYPYKMNRGNISAPPKMNIKYISLSGVAAQDEIYLEFATKK